MTIRCLTAHLSLSAVLALTAAGCGDEEESHPRSEDRNVGREGSVPPRSKPLAAADRKPSDRTMDELHYATLALERCLRRHDADGCVNEIIRKHRVAGVHARVASDGSFVVTARSRSGAEFTTERLRHQQILYTCAPPGVGGCSSQGAWRHR